MTPKYHLSRRRIQGWDRFVVVQRTSRTCCDTPRGAAHFCATVTASRVAQPYSAAELAMGRRSDTSVIEERLWREVTRAIAAGTRNWMISRESVRYRAGLMAQMMNKLERSRRSKHDCLHRFACKCRGGGIRGRVGCCDDAACVAKAHLMDIACRVPSVPRQYSEKNIIKGGRRCFPLTAVAHSSI